MSEFLKSNGGVGLDLCFHTATGYQCIAHLEENQYRSYEPIMLSIRHLVGADGRPYTEMGFSGLEMSELDDYYNRLSQLLIDEGYSEVHDLTDYNLDDGVFVRYVPASDGSIAIHAPRAVLSISEAARLCDDLMTEAARNFILEQENVPDILFESIMAEMGDELRRGPGGDDMALQRARDLARSLNEGYSAT